MNGSSQQSQIGITGQYYNLGYYPKDTTVNFKVSFYGTKAVSFVQPQVVGLNTNAFEKAISAVQEKGVDLTTGKRSASGTFTADKDQVLVTTIPLTKVGMSKLMAKKLPQKPLKMPF